MTNLHYHGNGRAYWRCDGGEFCPAVQPEELAAEQAEDAVLLEQAHAELHEEES